MADDSQLPPAVPQLPRRRWGWGLTALVPVALVMLAGVGAWNWAQWRVDSGAIVPCASFRPSPDLWHWTDTIKDRSTPVADLPAEPAWPAAVREANGTVRCSELAGRSQRQVTLMLGEPTDTPTTKFSEVLDLRADERAWSYSRASPVVQFGQETIGVVVRFADGGTGRAIAVRRYRHIRVV